MTIMNIIQGSAVENTKKKKMYYVNWDCSNTIIKKQSSGDVL